MAADEESEKTADVGLTGAITVTAEKRETEIQKTPVSVTLLTAADLEQRGIKGNEDLQFQVPALTFGVVFADTQISLRGIGNENITPGGDPGVALHVDGIYLGRPNAALIDFLELERVEVLRGPQGTLYGRNSTGGSINLLTRSASRDLTGRVDLGAGDYDLLRASGSVSGPLKEEKVFGLLSAGVQDRDGYHVNLVDSSTLDDNEYTAFRGKLDVDFSQRSRLELSGWIHDQGGAGSAAKALNDGFPNARESMRDATQTQDNEYSGFTGIFTHSTDNLELVSLSSVQESTTDLFLDSDGTAFPFQTVGTILDSEQISQELRLSSTDGGDGSWQVGLFYFEEDIVSDFELQSPFLGPYLIDSLVETQSFAVFGRYAHQVNDRVGLYAGVRYNDDDKSAVDTQFFPAFGLNFSIPQQVAYEEVSGDAGVNFQLSPQSFLFVKYSRGYKSGGFNLPGNGQPYLPEFVNAFEVGLKNLLSQDRVRLNATVFRYDYEDMQVFQISNFQTVIENAAQATVTGAEVELHARLAQGSLIDVSVAYLDATYDEFVSLDPLNPFAGFQDLSGNTLNRAPELTFRVAIQHAFDLGDSGYLTPRAEYNWRDDVFFRQFNLAQETQESFSRSDLRLMWESSTGAYRGSVWLKNLEDDDVIGNMLINSLNLSAMYYAPQTLGADFGLRF